MTRWLPADLAAEEADARAENHLDRRTLFGDFQHAGQFGKGSGEIGVPETDVIRRCIDRRENPPPHRLRFPAVFLEVHDRAWNRLDDLQRVVSAAIVHE